MRIRSALFMEISLTTILLTSVFVVGITTSKYSTTSLGEYDLWCDLDDDGDIDIFDIVDMAGRYGTAGTPTLKTSLEFDSGWVNIADKQGQYFNIAHNMSIEDWDNPALVIDVVGKATPDGTLQRLGQAAGWNKTYFRSGRDFARCFIETDDGGYVGVGSALSSAVERDTDFWLVKVDATGNHEWNKTYGKSAEAHAAWVVQTADGGYAIAGKAGYVTEWDFWLVKVDATGNHEWNKTYGVSGEDIAVWIRQKHDGGFLIFGSSVGLGPGNWDFWLISTDAFGDPVWTEFYGGVEYDYGTHAVETSDGGCAMVGSTRCFGAGETDVWLVKVDATGNHEWNKTYGGTGFDAARAVIETSDGGFALIGYTASFGAGDYDFWLVKVDATGNHEWNKTYGGASEDWPYCVRETTDGGFIIAGNTFSFSVSGGADAWLIKTDPMGVHQWNQTFGDTYHDYVCSIFEPKAGVYVLGGSRGSSSSFRFWLFELNFKSGITWTNSTATAVRFYRDPADMNWNYIRVRIWKVKNSP